MNRYLRTAKNALVPYFDVDFAGGNEVALFDVNNSIPDYYMNVPEFAGCTAFRAYSDSMKPMINNGSMLFAKEVPNWEMYLEFGEIYGIVCMDGRKFLKYIRRDRNNPKEYFLLHSENSEYDDFELPKSAIRSIWHIHGWFNRKS